MQRKPICTRAEGTGHSCLQTLLKQGEYGDFANAVVFESTFLQVTKTGEFVSLRIHADLVTVGILASNAHLALPDHLVIAGGEELIIDRMIPMDLVDIFLHNLEQRCLKVKQISGKSYYMRLHAPEQDENFLFDRWIKFIYLLRSARGTVTTAKTANTPKRKSPPPNKNTLKTGDLEPNVTKENLGISTLAHISRQNDPSRPGNRITQREMDVERSVTHKNQNIPLDVNHGGKDSELDTEGHVEMDMDLSEAMEYEYKETESTSPSFIDITESSDESLSSPQSEMTALSKPSIKTARPLSEFLVMRRLADLILQRNPSPALNPLCRIL